MIDIKFLRENPDAVKENIKKKFQDRKLGLVDEVIKLDAESRAVKKQADELLEATKTKDVTKATSLKESLEKYVQDISSKLYESQQPQPEQPTNDNPQTDNGGNNPTAEDVEFEEVK